MAALNKPLLVQELTGGVDTTSPSHLVLPPSWRTAHNMRLDPTVQQVERKRVYATLTGESDVLNLSIVPGASPGYGNVLAFTRNKLLRLAGGTLASGKAYDGTYRRWSAFLYNGDVYYVNELNQVHYTDGASDVALTNSPKGRYVGVWYDHLIVGGTTNHPNGIEWSHLYNFDLWTPDATNEADHVDFVEWQQPDFPFSGVTGMGRIGSLWWVYTPTAIIPLRYVGVGRGGNVIEVIDDLILTRIGNTYPWSLVCLDKTHFFFDGIEKQFWAFDGQQVIPVGEPVRGYMTDNLHSTPTLASKIWGTVDVAKREIWWRFVSTASGSGTFDKAVVFNYRTKRWYTASTENVQAFCGAVFPQGAVSALASTVGSQIGTVFELGAGSTQIPRLYGGANGVIYRDEVSSDSTTDLLTADDPILESGDFLYGTLHSQKEVRAVAINATWDSTRDPNMQLEVGVNARDYLDDTVDWTDPKNRAGYWTRNLDQGRLTHDYRTGKAIRYRFIARNARGLRFTAYEPTVYSRGAEQ